MRKFIHILCFWCSDAALRDAVGHVDSTPHAVIEVDTWHLKVGKHAENVSLVEETQQTKHNGDFASRAVVYGPVQSVVTQHHNGLVYGPAQRIATHMFDEVSASHAHEGARRESANSEMSLAPDSSIEQQQDSPVRFMKVAADKRAAYGDAVNNDQNIPVQHNSSALLQKNSSNASVQVLAGSSTMQEQLLWGIPGFAVVIPWHIAIMMFFLVACMSCACTAFMLQGFNIARKKMWRLEDVDISGYESSGQSNEDTEVYDYSERPGPEPTGVTTQKSKLAGQKSKTTTGQAPALDVYDYNVDAPTSVRGRLRSSSSSVEEAAPNGYEWLEKVGQAWASKAKEECLKNVPQSSDASTEPMTSISER